LKFFLRAVEMETDPEHLELYKTNSRTWWGVKLVCPPLYLISWLINSQRDDSSNVKLEEKSIQQSQKNNERVYRNYRH
jgi:hypothetical protein